jgi:hypothetical protein
MHTFFQSVLTVLIAWSSTLAPAKASGGVDRSASNLMVVLRESVGSHHPKIDLSPVGPSRFKLPDGKESQVEMAWYKFLGDMHIRFVFDGPNTMLNATPYDLKQLSLTPEAALERAVFNIRRVYGEPRASTLVGGVLQVKGKSPDLDSSYFLDTTFWNDQLRKHPDGLVVAIPKRGGLLFAAIADAKTVETLKMQVGYLHKSSEHLRVSSALYLFKNSEWSVFQSPTAK